MKAEPWIITVARQAHEHKCDLWRGIEYPGLARPFSRPDNMPDHRWRVSWDVMQALGEAAPDPIGNPKTADGATKLLFGWPIEVDEAKPAGTLLLERV